MKKEVFDQLELDIILNSVLFYFASKLFILISFNCFASRSMTTILTFFAQCQKGESTKNVITLKSVRFIFTFCYFFCIMMIEDVILKRKAETSNKKNTILRENHLFVNYSHQQKLCEMC